MRSRTNILISFLIAAVIVLAIAQVYTIRKLSNNAAQSVMQPAHPGGVATQAVSAVPPSTIMMPISGTVMSADSSHIVIGNASSTRALSIDPSTVIVQFGALKDSQQQAADMEAFRLSSNELAKDPEKNKLLLQTLVAPSPFKETKIAASDIKPGAEIVAYTFIQGGSVYAVRVNVLSVAQ